MLFPWEKRQFSENPGGLRPWEKVATGRAAPCSTIPPPSRTYLAACRTASVPDSRQQLRLAKIMRSTCCLGNAYAAWRGEVGRKRSAPDGHQPDTACPAVEAEHERAEMPCDCRGQVYWGVFVTAMAVLLFSRVVAPAAKKEPVRFHPIPDLPHARDPHESKHGRRQRAHSYFSSKKHWSRGI